MNTELDGRGNLIYAINLSINKHNTPYQEIMDWMKNTFKTTGVFSYFVPPDEEWALYIFSNGRCRACFRNKAHATMFLLRWQ